MVRYRSTLQPVRSNGGASIAAVSYTHLDVYKRQAFDEAGIRGFTADYLYDYTYMETLQGLSATELKSTEGRKWRTAYSLSLIHIFARSPRRGGSPASGSCRRTA